MSKRKKEKAMQVQHSTAMTRVDNPSRFLVPDLHETPTGELVYVPSKVDAARNLRDDPLGQMHQRRQIEDHLYRAGRNYQATREREGIGRGRSSSDIREFVDGGCGPSDGLTDTRMDAAKQITRWRSILGDDGYRLIEAVLIDKMTLKQCALRFYGGVNRAKIVYVGRIFRGFLADISKDMGLTT